MRCTHDCESFALDHGDEKAGRWWGRCRAHEIDGAPREVGDGNIGCRYGCLRPERRVVKGRLF